MAWKPEVEVDGKFSRNGLVFETKEEAEANAQNLMDRWLLVTGCRAVEVNEKPNYRWVDGKLDRIIEEERTS